MKKLLNKIKETALCKRGSVFTEKGVMIIAIIVLGALIIGLGSSTITNIWNNYIEPALINLFN